MRTRRASGLSWSQSSSGGLLSLGFAQMLHQLLVFSRTAHPALICRYFLTSFASEPLRTNHPCRQHWAGRAECVPCLDWQLTAAARMGIPGPWIRVRTEELLGYA